MKKYFLLISLLLLSLSFYSKAQEHIQVNAIFLTENSYLHNQPDYMLTDSDRIQFNEFFNGKRIRFTMHGQLLILDKAKVYGYRYNRTDYRLYDNIPYRIVDTTGFVLYSKVQMPSQHKNMMPEERFYYSSGEDKKIKLLTLENLNHSFRKQAEFRYALQNNFRSDKDLMQFDNEEHEYKLKYLYTHYHVR